MSPSLFRKLSKKSRVRGMVKYLVSIVIVLLAAQPTWACEWKVQVTNHKTGEVKYYKTDENRNITVHKSSAWVCAVSRKSSEDSNGDVKAWALACVSGRAYVGTTALVVGSTTVPAILSLHDDLSEGDSSPVWELLLACE